jgi:hypothetical protein
MYPFFRCQSVACETSIRTHRSPSRSSNKRQTAFFFFPSPINSTKFFVALLQKKTCLATNWRGQRGAPSFSRQKRNPELARKNTMVGTRTQGQQDEPQGSNPSETSQMVSVEALMKLIERIHPTKPTEPPTLPAWITKTQKHSWRSAKQSSPTLTLRCGAKRWQPDSGTQRPNGGASTHHSLDPYRTWRRLS